VDAVLQTLDLIAQLDDFGSDHGSFCTTRIGIAYFVTIASGFLLEAPHLR
jgi:hypothetical protein